MDRNSHRVAEFLQRVEPRATWGVVPPMARARVRQLCGELQAMRRTVSRRAPRWSRFGTKALSLLFSGPPGSGKAATAEVVASELGLPLYRVDLGRVVGKYIGETEKNLAAALEPAAASEAVLFFDEADALFGRRTGVSDAHDRYANAEVGYLLRRLERFQGIVILATNLRSDLDAVLLRRMAIAMELRLPKRLAAG